jgi:murein DD-endopeptidase MepM/ murein hydrolase activator NlpD
MRSARASARLRLAVAVIALAAAGCTREAPPGSVAAPAPAPPAVTPPPPPPPSAFARMVFPTEQTALLSAPPESVFQPTAAGRIESAFFGPVRTASSGFAQFHEGIDIAATRRDRSGRALDRVFAAAPGTVGYINRASGNSNYGIYVVLLHEDPVGSAYSLYAHLSQVKPGLQAGSAVQAGDELGVMGNTPSTSIPVARSHTHFEVGLVNNSRFRAWFLGQKLKPDHGMFNGWNLLAIDALKVLERQQALGSAFTLRDHLATLPRAFRIVVQARRPPDFFRRYPSLWTGETGEAPAVVLECTDNGLPLAGRPATPEEAQALSRRPAAVLSVDEAALGRNGCRLVVKRNGNWEMGKASERWLSILLY